MTFQQTLSIMVLMHFFADYTLQGWLADGKQKSWWAKLIPSLENTKYRYDYVMALACHSMYWSLLVCAPFFAERWFLAAVAANSIVHGIVDDLKANKLCINLWVDQSAHFLQILVTLFFMYVI